MLLRGKRIKTQKIEGQFVHITALKWTQMDSKTPLDLFKWYQCIYTALVRRIIVATREQGQKEKKQGQFVHITALKWKQMDSMTP